MLSNKIFINLLHLAGLVERLNVVVELMKKSGYAVTISQVRDWRRSKNSKNCHTVPDFALDVLFNYLFDSKRNNIKNNLLFF